MEDEMREFMIQTFPELSTCGVYFYVDSENNVCANSSLNESIFGFLSQSK
jgi:hypothetical protein